MVTDTTPEGMPALARLGKSWRRTTWRMFKAACLAGAMVYPVASLLSRRLWLADLISHFQVPALFATLLAVAVLARGHRRLAVILALLAAIQTVPLFRYTGANPVPADPQAPERLRLLLANVLYDNVKHDDLVRLIRSERPDVVGILEYTPQWHRALAALHDEFPYRMERPGGADGLALWFRERPDTIDEPVRPVVEGFPFVHASFRFAGKLRHIWLVHPTSPFLRAGKAGNPELDAIAGRVRRTGGSCLVMGDMNCTDGSAHFWDFLKVTGLRDSRLSFGRQPSWPVDGNYRIAIDHAFVSDDLAVVSRRLGPDVGSDHLPVVLDLAPALPKSAGTKSDQAATSSP
jgi:endonuclease/exonuclease/phosphatase (EEP) superfamily protein YafD